MIRIAVTSSFGDVFEATWAAANEPTRAFRSVQAAITTIGITRYLVVNESSSGRLGTRRCVLGSTTAIEEPIRARCSLKNQPARASSPTHLYLQLFEEPAGPCKRVRGRAHTSKMQHAQGNMIPQKNYDHGTSDDAADDDGNQWSCQPSSTAAMRSILSPSLLSFSSIFSKRCSSSVGRQGAGGGPSDAAAVVRTVRRSQGAGGGPADGPGGGSNTVPVAMSLTGGGGGAAALGTELGHGTGGGTGYGGKAACGNSPPCKAACGTQP